MPDLSTTSASIPSDVIELQEKFIASPLKNQLQLLPQLIEKGLPGIEVLTAWLQEQRGTTPTIVVGAVYQAIYQSEFPAGRAYLDREFPTGIVPLVSSIGVDYTQLQQLLAQQNFQAADKLTNEKLCELAGKDAVQRKWIYFTEVEQLPALDLHTIDTLWLAHSGGKFGFSVQSEMWMGMNKNWDKFWPKIGWKEGNNWTRYPGAFTWDLTAPRGHLPLSNQLRGVRVISALLSHPAWEKVTN
ncbi:GUN4 N-terminal ARM-like repeat domain-containing protein [Chamaesiphon sp. OTE_8_metabat_110]|uniref:GUN4 N-terminal ARM-like repeat domain-containing protein n=1 Tax=Chamaesiphon sp. OTE_8_metabat_110 TaxID=2964696 RepID=UPI00286D62E4|nr:GUN4 N-terminal ARM-like repeat domain-containing protein [Chamaesiphon sp. OTE_8_metabat_110]